MLEWRFFVSGVRCVDVGVPQFAMHSIRETCGIDDVATSHRLFVNFFADLSKLDAQLQVDL